MERREATLSRIRERIESLCSSFDVYIETFNKLNLFSGPSLYFHFRTLDRLNEFREISYALNDNLYLEYLYATLTSWGLHRMGPGGAKLVKFDEFADSIRTQKNAIQSLEKIQLSELAKEKISYIVDALWDIMNKITVSASKTKLVANSKTLHHILPNLMPPIDREYTLRFFFNHKTINNRDEQLFREIFPLFHEIGIKCKKKINSHIGTGFHTSFTKVIDNVIVGFVLKELK